jgi:hypothetical membrane protein
MMIGSVGAIGIGLFPENAGSVHLLVSGITFFFSGLAAITSYRISRPPMSFISGSRIDNSSRVRSVRKCILFRIGLSRIGARRTREGHGIRCTHLGYWYWCPFHGENC